MKLILAVTLTLICLTAEATQDNPTPDKIIQQLKEIHNSVRSRFKYTVGNPKGEVFEYYTSDDEVAGDCDDFASAVYYELWKRDYNPKIIMYTTRKDRLFRKGYKHVIVCTKSYCFDNNRKDIYKISTFDRYVRSGKFYNIHSGILRIAMMEHLRSLEISNSYDKAYDMITYGEMQLAVGD